MTQEGFTLSNPGRFGDVRDKTLRTRSALGFPPKRSMWRDAPAYVSEHTLTINGHSVMEDWETNYMQVLASIACSQKGKVLEVGFGLGIAARFVHRHTVSEHVVIESNRDVFQRLTIFADNHSNVVPIYGFWQDITPTIPSGTFSGILFDTYPLVEAETHCNHFSFFREAWRLLAPGGIFTYYSDEISNLSLKHKKLLQEVGFRSIQEKIVSVVPPAECTYWKSSTIVAPIVIK